MKSTLHMYYITPRVTNFRQFRCTIIPFEDIATFTIFPLTPMLKFQSAIQISKLGRMPRKVIACIASWKPMSTIHDVCLSSDENCRRSSVLNCPAPYGPVLTKCQNAINF